MPSNVYNSTKQSEDEDFECLGKLAANEITFDTSEKGKPESKRRSIKFKCKSVTNKPNRRSTRHTVRKNYSEEEVPDDDHYICESLCSHIVQIKI